MKRLMFVVIVVSLPVWMVAFGVYVLVRGWYDTAKALHQELTAGRRDP